MGVRLREFRWEAVPIWLAHRRPVTPTTYLHPMSCVEIPEPVERLLKALSEEKTVPVASLDQDAAGIALRYGCVYEYRGMLGLTGAGAYHVSEGRGGGMLE